MDERQIGYSHLLYTVNAKSSLPGILFSERKQILQSQTLFLCLEALEAP